MNKKEATQINEWLLLFYLFIFLSTNIDTRYTPFKKALQK